MKILYANANGLKSKLDSLQAASILYEPDIIVIVETKVVGKTLSKGIKNVSHAIEKPKGVGY